MGAVFISWNALCCLWNRKPGRAGREVTDEISIMKMIQPNCRVQFTAADVAFIIEILGAKIGARQCLIQLLADEDTRDLILDDEQLFHALLERRGCLQISARLYFYVLVRRVFQKADLPDRRLADYVAELLTEFSETRRQECVPPGQTFSLDYFFDMVAALQTTDARTSFLLRMHIGNQSLFLAGVFPDRIRSRAERRGFPDLSYYESLGSTHYRLAGEHPLAHRYQVDGILLTLSERFQTTRRALNDLAERLLSLGDPDFGPLPILHNGAGTGGELV